MLHQFEKSAVTFRLGIIARKMQNGSNDSKLYLFKIFSCKLFSNHFIFNRQILFDFFLISFHQFLQWVWDWRSVRTQYPPRHRLRYFEIISNLFSFAEMFVGSLSRRTFKVACCAGKFMFLFNICYYAWVYSAKNLTSSPPSFAILRKYSLLCFFQLAGMRLVGSLRGGRLRWCAAWDMFQSSQMCGLHPTAAGITTCPSQS